MSAPTPPVPTQRDSSGLDAAVAARSMHPSIPWTPGDGKKHGRVSSEVDAGTRCGLAGPLTLAGKTLPFCGDCYGAPETAAE